MDDKQPTDPDDPYLYDPPSAGDIAGDPKSQLESKANAAAG